MKLLLLSLLVIAVSANVRILHVVLNQEAGNGAYVTYKNFGTDPVDVSGYWIGTADRHTRILATSPGNINSIQLGGDYPVLPAGGTLTVDYTNWASVGSDEKLSDSSDLALWKNNQFYGWGSWLNMVDFVQWCHLPALGVNPGSCPDFGETDRAQWANLWNGPSSTRSHVGYITGHHALSFVGGAEDRGVNFWDQDDPELIPEEFRGPTTTTAVTTTTTTTAATTTTLRPDNTPAPPDNPTTDNVLCSELSLELAEIQVRLNDLKTNLGC